MYRINSISSQIVKLQVKTNGALKAVDLLPGNFVFSDELTDQLKNMEFNKVIRVREVKKTVAQKAQNSTAKPAATQVQDAQGPKEAPATAVEDTDGTKISSNEKNKNRK